MEGALRGYPIPARRCDKVVKCDVDEGGVIEGRLFLDGPGSHCSNAGVSYEG